MSSLPSIGVHVATERKASRLSQLELARRARVSRATVDALENGRLGELGYTRLTNILTVLGLELKLRKAGMRRPTLEELLSEENDEQR